MITNEQKHFLIDTAQELYRTMFPARLQNDPFANEIDINTFKEACHDMSVLVHYLAKEECKITKESNKVYHCLFKYNGITASHYFNKIDGQIVDSTIMQFNNLSPYDNHDDCYTELEEILIDNDCYKIVENEIDFYECKKYSQCYFEHSDNMTKNRKNFWEKLIVKIFKNK